MKALLAATAAFSLGGIALAQEFTPTANLGLDVRIDYQQLATDGTVDDANSGFKGRYLNVVLDGNITPKWTYNLRQRLNKAITDATFMDATDWVYVTYKPNERWNFSAGKLVVAIGSCEYDKASIDIYRGSEFWHNIPCYQMGVSGSYTSRSGKDQLVMQLSESPFRSSGNNNMYAYNLLWYGYHGWINTIYSANMIEATKNHYISYLVLGNRFNLGAATLDVDFINRAADHQTYLFRDCSVMAECGVQVSAPWRIFAKATYDVNKSGTATDQLVLAGTEIAQAGIGAEYYAFKHARNDLRIHACYYYSWGKNSNPAGTMQDRMTLINLGLKWHVDVLRSPRR